MLPLAPSRAVVVTALAALAALGASCAPIRFSSQEVVLRPRAESDALDVLVLYDGIQAVAQKGEDDGIAAGRRFAESVAGGKRELMIWDWPLHVVLEETLEDLADLDGADSEAWKAWKREGVELLGAVHVVSAGQHSGEDGRLSIHQHVRIERWSRVLEWADRSLRLWILEFDARGTVGKDLHFLDAPSRAAWVAMARKGERWLTAADGGLRVELPASPAVAARLLERLLEDAAREPDAALLYRVLTADLAELEVSGGRMRFTWKPREGEIRLRFARPGEYDPALAEAVGIATAKELPGSADVLKAFRAAR